VNRQLDAIPKPLSKFEPIRVVEMIERALLGRRKPVELATCAFIAGGHLLIEDVPGVGKTTLARALARASGGEFRRVQFTSDLLPADITGVSVWNPSVAEFEFKPGPVFGNLVLADEINRSPPKTQSALLEAMSEGQVSVDGEPRDLPRPFMVIATQNLQEHHGTYPLPESPLDRFMMRIPMGYPDTDAERRVVSRVGLDDPVDQLEPVVSPAVAAEVTAAVDGVRVDETVLDYLMDLIARTRQSDLLSLGVGPRGGMALHRASRALALLKDRDYVLIDDVKELAEPVLAHRVIPAGGAGDSAWDRELSVRAIREIVGAVEIPL
jgi:MoxR-like ATPase